MRIKRSSLVAVLALVLSSVHVPAAMAQSAALVADYRFQNTFTSSAGSAPALAEIGPEGVTGSFATDTILGVSRPVYTWPRDNGLALNTTGLVPNDSYTIAVLFRFAETDSWRSIINFTNGVSDNALYNYHGGLQLWPQFTAPEPSIYPARYVQVVFSRDAAGNIAGYVNGELQISGVDSTLSLIDEQNTLWFFRDGGNGSEESPGAVARLRLWNGPLSDAEIRALDDTPPPLEPPAPECADYPGAQCGSTGDDELAGNDGAIIGGSGDDTITATIDDGTESLLIDGGGDDDTLILEIEDPTRPVPVTMVGGGGVDTIIVPKTPGAVTPTIDSGDGNDVVRVVAPTTSRRGKGGRFIIRSGAGRDRLTAGTSGDRIDAGGGPDEVNGGGGNDRVGGGGGKDVLRGGGGANLFVGGAGSDTCISDSRKDKFRSCEKIRRNYRRNHGFT